jgi:NDP-sugar pyrophosphorylase family protein
VSEGPPRIIDLPVAILAGGLATRLQPITVATPKVLLEVAGKPFLEHQLLKLRTQGVREIVLCVGYLGERVRDQFGDGSSFGVSIRYSFDGPTLLGTGGAIRAALPFLGDAFFVLYGDSYLEIEFASVADAFRRSGKRAMMTVFRNHDRWDTSNVWFEKSTVKIYDKHRRLEQMRYIDYGLSVLDRSVIDAYPPNIQFDLADALSQLAVQGQLAGYEAQNRFYEIGSFAGLKELDELLRTNQSRQ